MNFAAGLGSMCFEADFRKDTPPFGGKFPYFLFFYKKDLTF